MKRKQISEALKRYGFKIIKKSWYVGDLKDNSVLFNAYDDCGTPYQFYINWEKQFARRQMYSTVTVHGTVDITGWFF